MRKVIAIILLTATLGMFITPTVGQTQIGITAQAKKKKHHYINGVNKVKSINWYSEKVWVSRNRLHSWGKGSSFAGIWAGALYSGLAGACLASAGMGLSSAPGGIWYKYNRLLSGFGGGLQGWGWQ